MNPGLYVVATPIGNLGDLSPRATETLRSADLIAVEDSRHSGRLLQACGVATPTLSYHDHNAARVLDRIVSCLSGGGRVALICDAGTPLISDPGYRLVRHAQDNGFAVYTVPGACAAIAALSVAGLPTDRFRFEGFLPPRATAREKRLDALAGESITLVFYEAPHRLEDSLRSMIRVLGGEREAVLARELTKVFETVRRDSLAALADFVAADPNQSRGEIVLLVAGAAHDPDDLSPEAVTLLERLAEELPARRAAAVVADVTGLRRQALYDYLLRQRAE
ncbi:MAG: 16S rRNA (cytidine(1402)-2'-O)-methyltransferase [Halioglobus sp.]|nr:16S rRNA (cytidine(1402)-2'-O)-methyltransferase [Halioglobus sp.]